MCEALYINSRSGEPGHAARAPRRRQSRDSNGHVGRPQASRAKPGAGCGHWPGRAAASRRCQCRPAPGRRRRPTRSSMDAAALPVAVVHGTESKALLRAGPPATQTEAQPCSPGAGLSFSAGPPQPSIAARARASPCGHWLRQAWATC